MPQGLQQPPQLVERNALTRRVVGAGDEHDVGCVLLDRLHRDVGVEAEVVGTVGHQPFGLGAVGDDRVHRIRRHEADRAAAGAAERLQQLLQDLVGTVGGPQVFDTERGAGLRAQVGGQVGAQRHRVAVGIAVQVAGDRLDRGRHVVDQRLGGRMRVLVGVEPHRNVQLRCAVRRFAAQILAQRQIVQRHLFADRHVSNLRRTASPCAGRFSACDSVIT